LNKFWHNGRLPQLGFSRANISVAIGVTRAIFGAISYVWGLNIWGKFQGHGSRASYICQVSHVGILGVSAQHWGGVLSSAWRLGPKFLRHYILRNSVSLWKWKVWLFWLVLFSRYESAYVAFRTVVLPTWACLSAL